MLRTRLKVKVLKECREKNGALDEKSRIITKGDAELPHKTMQYQVSSSRHRSSGSKFMINGVNQTAYKEVGQCIYIWVTRVLIKTFKSLISMEQT